MRISEGKPYPLGATAESDGANFAVFSAHATRVEVCLFDAPDAIVLNRAATKTPRPELQRRRAPELASDDDLALHRRREPERRFSPNRAQRA